MNVDRALVFKSIDAKKQNPQNRPGKFTVNSFLNYFWKTTNSTFWHLTIFQ